MGWVENGAERRSFPRIDLKATALLLQRGDAVGRFTVQNLSASGALLTGAHDVRLSAPMRLLLELPSGEALTVGAHVKRRAVAAGVVALAVAFRHLHSSSEDCIQDSLVDLLDRKHRAEHPGVLVVEAVPSVRADLVERIGSLGRRVLAAEAPLSAIRILDDPEEHIDALLVRDGGQTTDLLEFVAENHPAVRPLLFVQDPTQDPSVAHRGVVRCGPAHLCDVLKESPSALLHAL